jgi:hypothetical protein
MDELKKHILHHADEMNFDVPNAALWENIEAELEPPVRKLSPVRIIRFAAAACLIFLAGAGVWFLTDKEEGDVIVAEKKPVPVQPKQETVDTVILKSPVTKDNVENNVEERKLIASVPASIQKAEKKIPVAVRRDPNAQFISAVNQMSASFINVVNLQRKELSKTAIYGETGDYYSDFKAQFYRLEKEEQDLKKQMSKSGPADNALERLIDIYQQKINVLKQLQNEINKTNSRYKLSRPDDKSVSKQFINI